MCFWLPVTRKGTFAQLYVFRFSKGQPLGFYSSWPVFTLTHHMLVWYAAWRVRLGVKFFDYALLGDDIVIADPVVAKSYLEVMEECKVTISKEKSLISNVSALEFAKRFMVYKVTLDFSPVSLRVLRTLSSGVSAFLFSELRVNLLCSYRLRGGSYKVYSRQGLPTSKRWKRHYLLMFSPTGILPLPLKFWLAFTDLGVLTAEQYGMVRAFIMERVYVHQTSMKLKLIGFFLW